MKYVGRLVLVLQAVLMAGWAHAVTVTVNGNDCGSTTSAVEIATSGDITISTNGTGCAPGSVTPGGPYTVQVNRSGTGVLGTVTANAGTGNGLDCGSDCNETYESGSTVTLTASAPSGDDTFTWGGACSGTQLTCTISNITSNKTVSATYSAAGATVDCPTGVTCIERTSWPTIPQETLTMKGNAVMAIKINTTTAGLWGLLSTMFTTGTTGNRQVMLATTPGSFDSDNRHCFKEGLEVTSTSWQQAGTMRACQLPANSTAWINVRFTNCPATSNCSFYLKSN